MDKVLSQEEVDTLLGEVSEGKVETDKRTAVDESAVKPYDLTSRDRDVKGRMPTLEIINENFSRLFKSSLSIAVRKVVNINSVSVSMIKFGEFVKTLPVPTSLHIYKMSPLKGHALMVIGGKLVYTFVDIFVGGEATKPIEIEGKDITSIENRLIKRIVLIALEDLQKAWHDIYPITTGYVRSEVNPQSTGIVITPDDLVVVTEFSIEIEKQQESFLICLPYPTIEPISDKLYASFQSEQLEVDRLWTERLENGLRKAKVEIVVELGCARLKARDLLNLDVGDVIQLNTSIFTPLIMKVEGIPRYKGHAGTFRGSMAFQITEEVLLRENLKFRRNAST